MKKGYFTFLYVPNSNAAVSTLRIPKLFVYLSVLFAFAGLGATGFFVYKYVSRIGEVYKLSSLEKENIALKSKLEEFSGRMAMLEKQILQNFDFQKKARLLANLDEVGEDVAEVGVGGAEFAYARSLPLLDSEIQNKVESIGSEIEKLIRQAELQKKSYEEIISNLSDQTELLNSTPSIRPVPGGFVSSRFGRRMDPFTGRLATHKGVDYSVRQYTPIFATADGVVTFAGRWYNFGKIVEISHGYGYVTRYAHVSKILVKKGQQVRRGDIIARVGSSGRSTAAHLHYEIFYNGVNKNPLAYVLPSGVVVN